MFITAAFFAMGSVSLAAQTSTHGTSMKDVKEKAEEAVQAIKDYSVNQRDEAVKKAKAAMDKLDARINSMESELDKKWSQMDESAREKGRASLTALRKQRDEVAEWYGGLKHSSRKAWEDVKKGFLKSYQELRESLNKAHSEF